MSNNKFEIRTYYEAELDILDIFNYILYHDGKEQAKTIKTFLEEKINSLTTFPERGKYPQELLDLSEYNYRELTIYPWRIFYEIDNSTVWIFAVLDGRRDLEKILKERLLRN